jgi:ABC-2 type transport system permease protein
VLGDASFVGLFALIIGIVAVTNEFRHGTITPTLLTTPRREIVVLAKAIAAILVSIGFALLAFLTLAVVGSIWLAAVGADNQLADPDVLGAAAKLLLAAPIWALVGIAVGVLVQSQVAALVGTLIWIFLAETIIVAVLELLDVGGLADYLPFQALDAADGTSANLLPYWTAVGVSLAWALVLGAAGTERLRRRDIT